MTNNLAPQQPKGQLPEGQLLVDQPPISEQRPVATEVVAVLDGTNARINDKLEQEKLRSLQEQIELSIKENGEKLAAIGQMINEVCGEGYVK